MRFNPHPYQSYCVRRMIEEPRLGLFLSMGLGKTVITLTALNEMIYYRGSAERALVIAPKRVAETTWTDEKDKWDHLSHLRVSRMLGSAAERLAAAERDADIYVINRENVPWLVEEFRSDWKWDTVVIDELSSFKNPRSKRFKRLKLMLPRIRRLYGLTGTPAANGMMDLWAQVYLLDGGARLYGTLGQYRERFFDPDKRNAQVVFSYKLKPGAEERIRARVSDICVTFGSSELPDRPRSVTRDFNIRLSPASRRAYERMERECFLELGGEEITASNAGVLTNKLLQIASGNVYDEDGRRHGIHGEKIEALSEIVEQAGGDSVLVFYNYRHELEAALEAFPGARALESDEDARAWNRGEVGLLLAHPASCAYGLNLQAGGHIIVWLSPTWNLELYEQANARLDRQGQRSTVIIHRIIAEGTIDETVRHALQGKDRVQSALLEALERRYREIVAG